MQPAAYFQKAISFVQNQHQLLYKAVLFVFSLATIVYIFPKQTKFKYEFHNLKGKPWNHDNLIAPFDFSIRKTQREISAERDEILKNSKPYFVCQSDVIEKNIASFKNNFETSFKASDKNTRNSYFLLGKTILDSIYQKGILQPTDIIENKPSDFNIFVLENNLAEEHSLNDFHTIASAYDYAQKKIEQKTKKAEGRQLLEILENCITHSVIYDKPTTEKVTKQALSNIEPSHKIIQYNQSIISKGEIVDAQKYQILESLKAEYEEQAENRGNHSSVIIGQIILIGLCLFVLFMFLSIFRKDIFADNVKLLFVLFIIILEASMVRIATNTQAISVYLLPFCILPVIIRSFYDTRIALFVHLIAILIISFMVPNPFEFVFIQLLAGIVTIFSIVNMRKRSQIFISSSFIFIMYSGSYTSINIIEEGGLDSIKAIDYAWFGISAALTLFSYPLIFVFEKIFGFISDVSILELSDTNGPLLRKLATIAPGTFQHSLQVANLAEEAIYAVGGNALLVRTGALYHDIGKMDNPLYFIENQTGGINPHDELNYEDSATIIIGHVIRGVEIAKKYNIPEQIIDFIRTHHGTSFTGYFYRSFKKDFPEEQIDDNKFRYPGPIPFSKETAVLMMADSVEAASRSLKKYDAEAISNLVDYIINKQIEEEQFVNANITFKDISNIKKIFKKKLMNIYHVRVEYPR